MIDWVSIKCPIEYFDLDVIKGYQSTQDHILRITGNGELIWEVSAWDSVRSDSHQIALQVTGNSIRIQGSPARIIADGDNVFSSGAAAASDLYGCWLRMVTFVSQQTGLPLPLNPKLWGVSRVDVTKNLYLGGLPQVRQALAVLRDCEGGRYRVSQQAGDTVYWSHRSRLRSGKAYAKGAEILHKNMQIIKSKIPQIAKVHDLDHIEMAGGLLRLELKLGAQYWRERVGMPWHEVTPDILNAEWSDYFSRMIGGAEMTTETDIYTRILGVVDTYPSGLNAGKPKEGQAKAAYSLWCLIKSEGWQKARDITTKRTWYRNLKILHLAGLSDADISTGKIVPFRSRILEAVPVESWGELRNLYFKTAA